VSNELTTSQQVLKFRQSLAASLGRELALTKEVEVWQATAARARELAEVERQYRFNAEAEVVKLRKELESCNNELRAKVERLTKELEQWRSGEKRLTEVSHGR
jgi:chromosome segregation ATPase